MDVCQRCDSCLATRYSRMQCASRSWIDALFYCTRIVVVAAFTRMNSTAPVSCISGIIMHYATIKRTKFRRPFSCPLLVLSLLSTWATPNMVFVFEDTSVIHPSACHEDVDLWRCRDHLHLRWSREGFHETEVQRFSIFSLRNRQCWDPHCQGSRTQHFTGNAPSGKSNVWERNARSLVRDLDVVSPWYCKDSYPATQNNQPTGWATPVAIGFRALIRLPGQRSLSGALQWSRFLNDLGGIWSCTAESPMLNTNFDTSLGVW